MRTTKPGFHALFSALALIASGACSDDTGPAGGEVDAAILGDGQVLEPDAGAPACAAISTFADGLTPTAEVHVAIGGDDQSGDGSSGNPFATIERAADEAGPGTAIRVHAGTYAGDQYLSGLQGTAAAPIWLGGAPGEDRPVLQGGGEGLHLSSVRYLVVHDLEVSGSTQNGINCDDSGEYDNPDATRHVVFRDLYVHDVGSGGNQDCLKLSGVDDFFVLGSEFARCGGGGSGSGVDHVGCHDGVLAHNHFHELSGNAVQAKGGSRDLSIRWNRMEDAGERAVNMGGSTGFEFFRPPLEFFEPNAEAWNIEVLANEIRGSTAALAFVGCVDCVAANNTIVDPERWVARILQETTTTALYTFEPAKNGVLVNNLVYYDRGLLSTHINVGANVDEQSFSFAHNLWYAHDDAGNSAPDLPVVEESAVIGQDPGLSDVAGGDYSIAAASPAAGAGQAVAGLTGDIAGACYAEPPSIGAREVP